MNRAVTFGTKTLVMGIINVTPDSFYAGSRTSNTGRAIERALEFEELGADIVDVGGESTRPGSQAVDEEEEVRRVIPVIESMAALALLDAWEVQDRLRPGWNRPQ